MLNQVLIEEFGKRIRQLRTERNLSQEQLAELTGFHRTYIGMAECSINNPLFREDRCMCFFLEVEL